ncbi:histidine phosphatase family protein [Nocardia otitidiscaviarum]|nr:histidine phosphatase family protein [Nocardia otitidiscaviarum]MCP9622607.1 histidine phosphatase family protein [Nocardia otitidiscaviarum]
MSGADSAPEAAADTSDSRDAASETAASRPDVDVDVSAGAAAAGTANDEISVVTGDLNLPGEVASDVETIVHVLRHGEVHNPKGILYGRLSGFGLSVTGQAQAQAVARSLRDHDIALVVASPLQRAQETADPIATQHGLLIRTDDNLIEAGNTFEGLRVAARDGALRKPRHWLKLRDPFTPSWGEPYLQIAHRMLAAVNKARVEAAGREAVLVSHQLPVWTLRRFLQGQRLWHDPRRRQCSLASLTSLVYQGDTLIDIVYSEPAGATDPTVTGA